MAVSSTDGSGGRTLVSIDLDTAARNTICPCQFAGLGAYGNTAAYIWHHRDNFTPDEIYMVQLWNMGTTDQRLYQGSFVYSPQVTGNYVTWFDTAVPEPSSLVALFGLLVPAGIFMRRRLH